MVWPRKLYSKSSIQYRKEWIIKLQVPVSSKDIEKTWQKSLHQEIQGNRIFTEILKHRSQTTHPVVSSSSSVHSTIAIKQKMMITKK